MHKNACNVEFIQFSDSTFLIQLLQLHFSVDLYDKFQNVFQGILRQQPLRSSNGEFRCPPR